MGFCWPSLIVKVSDFHEVLGVASLPVRHLLPARVGLHIEGSVGGSPDCMARSCAHFADAVDRKSVV